MHAITEPNNLKYLNLSSCNINHFGAYYIFTNLDKTKSLKHLVLDNNKISGFKPDKLYYFLKGQKVK